MNLWQVSIHRRPGVTDHHGDHIRKECAHAGLTSVKKVRAGQSYALEGSLSEEEARRLASRLLADPVTQEFVLTPSGREKKVPGARSARVWSKNGVADPVADTVLLAARDLGIQGLDAVHSGQVYEFHGAAAPQQIRRFCEDYLMNALIQRVDVQ